MIQHFSEEQCIFYFAGDTPEQAQVCVNTTAVQFVPDISVDSKALFWKLAGLDEMPTNLLQ